MTEGAGKADIPVVLFHDGITGGKANAYALANGLGGEKRFKQFILGFKRNTAAVVFDDQFDAAVRMAESFDQDGSVLADGVKGVGQQVDDHLL